MQKSWVRWTGLILGAMFFMSGVAAEPDVSGIYRITALPIESRDDFRCDNEVSCAMRYPSYSFEQLDPALQRVLNRHYEKHLRLNTFKWEYGGGASKGETLDITYLFLPPLGSVQAWIESRSVVVNSTILVTLKDHEVVDQVLVGFGGPDSGIVMNYRIDEGYRIIVEQGETDDEHSEYVPEEERTYRIEPDGNIRLLKTMDLRAR